jgi:hypothetical protein
MFFSDEPQYTFDRDTMSMPPGTLNLKKITIFWFVLILLTGMVSALPDQQAASHVPSVFLNFNEGSGSNVLDSSGSGATGVIVGASRADNSGCGRSLVFDGSRSYVKIPFTTRNHPNEEISVSLWFFSDTYSPQTLVSTYQDGGYRLGFDDGKDLWWTLNIENLGDISVPVQHESISLNQWHYVAGTYDGKTAKIYLDGVLRNQVNASGTIHYQYPNYVILGADAGEFDSPDKNCPGYFHGGLDEVRIYNASLTQGQIIDDRLQCSQEPDAPPALDPVQGQVVACYPPSGSLTLIPGISATRILGFENKTDSGNWTVKVPPGSTLVVKAQDFYSRTYPDAWYVEIDDSNSKVNRGVAFPNTNNAPVEGVISSGDATVIIRYFDGPERFPASVLIQLDSIPPAQAPAPVNIIMSNPIIVIYSASWVTLIALVFVMVWLHLKNKAAKK